MPIDPRIALGVNPLKLDSPVNALGQVLQLEGQRRQNELGGLQLQEQRASAAERAGLRNYLGDAGNNLDTPEGQAGLYKVAPTQAGTILKDRLGLKSTQSTIDKNAAETAKISAETAHSAVTRALQTIPPSYDLQALTAWYGEALKNKVPGVTMQSAQQSLRNIPQDAQGYAKWRALQQLAGTDLAKQIELAMPKYDWKDAGGSIVPLQTNPMAGNVGPAPGLPQIGKTVSPDAQLSATTSRANNASTIAKDYVIAGIGPNGQPSENVETMAQAIAAGKAAPISGFALARPQGQQVMARVMAINPAYDATEFGAKVKAAKDFTTGSQGNAMRSFAVAGQHLDQLGQLVDALGNKDTQIINKIGNLYAEQTGNPAPTNFDAAKDVVSKEVVKAIVAGGGGVAERQELSDLMSKAKSPAQLKGVIAQYRNLMAAQHEALLNQRDAAGLSRSTLPKYTNPSGSADADLHSRAEAILRGDGK